MVANARFSVDRRSLRELPLTFQSGRRAGAAVSRHKEESPNFGDDFFSRIQADRRVLADASMRIRSHGIKRSERPRKDARTSWR